MSERSAQTVRPLVGDLRQVASVRRIVLDDGPERGVRALQFSTGGGLDFLILSDRCMDIGPLSWRGLQLAWISPSGFRAASLIDHEGDDGRGFNRGFSGFLNTTGLNHIRHAANGEPQHGRIAFTPASVTGYGEEWNANAPFLFCEGEAVQSRYGGEALRLRRRIEAPIGGASLSITDTIENIGAEPTPQPMLYHFNLGYPAIAEGTVVELNGEPVLGPIALPDVDGLADARTWPAGPDGEARCIVRTRNNGEQLAVSFAFDMATLGHLQLWHDLRPRIGVLSIEPCTSERRFDGTLAPERVLAPGESHVYRLRVAVEGQVRPELHEA